VSCRSVRVQSVRIFLTHRQRPKLDAGPVASGVSLQGKLGYSIRDTAHKYGPVRHHNSAVLLTRNTGKQRNEPNRTERSRALHPAEVRGRRLAHELKQQGGSEILSKSKHVSSLIPSSAVRRMHALSLIPKWLYRSVPQELNVLLPPLSMFLL
jgi:hypothetical protein